jgi:DNA-binding transcriptional ArsR family regulator
MGMGACELLCLDLEAAEEVRSALDPDRTAAIAATVKVLADPTRLHIAQALAQRQLCGCDLGWITGQSEKVISHHLGRLRRDGLVVSRREGKVVFASLTDRGHALLATIETLVA